MKNSRTVIQTRQNEILKMLQQNGRLSVEMLSERLGVTEATIRRDLILLEKEGSVRRRSARMRSDR